VTFSKGGEAPKKGIATEKENTILYVAAGGAEPSVVWSDLPRQNQSSRVLRSGNKSVLTGHVRRPSLPQRPPPGDDLQEKRETVVDLARTEGTHLLLPLCTA